MEKIFIYVSFLLVFKAGLAQNNFTDLVKKTEKAVVTVNTFNADGTALKVGTAFFIEESGILLSNYHVFSEAYSATIKTSEGKEYQVNKTISYNKELDLIKISITNSLNEHFPKLEMALSQPVKGEDIFVIGTPGGFESSVSKGIVSGIRDIPDAGRLFQITAPISPGSSGSPVLNMQGKVFGIASLQYQEGQNLNFAIDIKLVNKLKEATETLSKSSNVFPSKGEKIDALKYFEDKAISLTLLEQLDLISEYINSYPNDYMGYLIRAVLVYNNPFFRPEVETNSDFKQKMIECLVLSDKDFAKALQLSSNKSLIYYYRGISKFNQQEYYNPKLIGWDLKNALADLNRCNDSERGFENRTFHNYSKYEYIGDIKREMKDFGGAIAAYKQAIFNFPERKRIYQLYNKCAEIYYYELHEIKKASTNNEIAFSYLDISKIKVDILFYDWDMFILRANIRIELNDLSGALADVNFVLQCGCMEAINPYNHFLRAAILSEMDGDPYEIISSLSKAIDYTENEESRATYYDMRSIRYYLTEQYQLALIDKNKYFELTPPSKLKASDYNDRAKIKDELKDYVGALRDINKAIELDYKIANYHNTKAGILSGLNDKIGAVKEYDKAIELNPKESHYYIMRGYAKYDSNKIGACADWSKAGEMGDYSAYDLISKYCH